MIVDNVLTALLCMVVVVGNVVGIARCRSNPYNYMRWFAIVVAMVTLAPEVYFVATGQVFNQMFSYALLLSSSLLAVQAIVRIVNGDDRCP